MKNDWLQWRAHLAPEHKLAIYADIGPQSENGLLRTRVVVAMLTFGGISQFWCG